jgi:hypothetical protein
MSIDDVIKNAGIESRMGDKERVLATMRSLNPTLGEATLKSLVDGMFEPTLNVPTAMNTQPSLGMIGKEPLESVPLNVRPGTKCAPLPPASIDATLTERGKRYGVFKDHAVKTQQIKRLFHDQCGLRWGAMKDDQREALEMIAHKLGRIFNGDPDYADSWHDIAGYAQLVADRLNGDSR